MSKNNLNKLGWKFLNGLLLCLICCLGVACSDDDNGGGNEEPTGAPTVTDFIPKDGGVGQKLVIYGQNFGNDTARVRVTIGGKQAVVINVKNNCLYCLVPQGAYDGNIEVTVLDANGNAQTAQAADIFEYQRKMVVGTLTGVRNENDDQGWHDGPFETATGFGGEGCLTFDPLYKDHLYVVYDNNAHGIQLIDLTKRTVTTVISMSKFENQRLRSIDFSIDGKYMFVSTDRADRQYSSPSVWIVKRNADGSFNDESQANVFASYGWCNGAAVHPINGELYFNNYEKSWVFRVDVNAYEEIVNSGGTWKPSFTDHTDDPAFQQLFATGDNGWEFKIFIHPTGRYCYYVVVNQHYIMRSVYNEATKTFAPPYVVAGMNRERDWVDGVGTSARLNRPYQGCFVKNPEYVKQGKTDQYDFYFCDNQNHCIRYLTPDGIVRTYAGRGTSSSAGDNNFWGTEDGDLREVARFRDPTGIAYDEEHNTFYILDTVGRKIRTISMEK